jgi:hypothetical protein
MKIYQERWNVKAEMYTKTTNGRRNGAVALVTRMCI